MKILWGGERGKAGLKARHGIANQAGRQERQGGGWMLPLGGWVAGWLVHGGQPQQQEWWGVEGGGRGPWLAQSQHPILCRQAGRQESLVGCLRVGAVCAYNCKPTAAATRPHPSID